MPSQASPGSLARTSLSRADLREVVRCNLDWFFRSGILHPNDGFWGVAERVAVLRGNRAARRIHKVFPSQTSLAKDVVVLEHRRPDCNFQVAYLLDLAATALRRPALRRVADTILEYLLRRSCLQDVDPPSRTFGLWGWANPNTLFRGQYWTDDNAWVATLALALARRGRPALRETGVLAARGLLRHGRVALRHRLGPRRAKPFTDLTVLGRKVNPHWFGLATMAFSHASAVDPRTDYARFVSDYHRVVLDGPPKWDWRSARPTITGLPWAMSEYAYLALTASVAAARFPALPQVREVARVAAETLVKHQSPDGHFLAEHYEAPKAPHLADTIYTQNWATLGLYHAARLFQSPAYARAFRQSLAFLARIQDRSPEPWFRGCWRGLYDTRKGRWGGGDLHEGGQGSIYSGWTNAPISIAFLFALTGESFFVPGKGCPRPLPSLL